MHIAVTGGTGTLGSAFVPAVREKGHNVRVLSRRARPESAPPEVEWAQTDLTTAQGLHQALDGAEAVLHAATDPSSLSGKVDVEGTRRLLRTVQETGVEHVVYPSIVGIDEIPFRYYRHKREAERLIEESPVPCSILRATQFHALVGQVLAAAARVPLVTLLPTDFRVQSVAAAEVAERLVQCVSNGAAGRLPDFGGPAVHTLGDMVQVWQDVRQKERRVVRLPLPGKTAQAFRDGKNTAPNRREGTIRWRTWLEEERHAPRS